MSPERSISHRVYVVAWHDLFIIKAGYTFRDRWRVFLNRGAELIALSTHPTALDALGHESAIEAELDAHGERAFKDRSEAVALVGANGCGWSECYRVSPLDYSDVLTILSVTESVTESLTESIQRVPNGSHVLTNERTDEEGSDADRSLNGRTCAHVRGVCLSRGSSASQAQPQLRTQEQR